MKQYNLRYTDENGTVVKVTFATHHLMLIEHARLVSISQHPVDILIVDDSVITTAPGETAQEAPPVQKEGVNG